MWIIAGVKDSRECGDVDSPGGLDSRWCCGGGNASNVHAARPMSRPPTDGGPRHGQAAVMRGELGTAA
jgi:hypothetical protein